MEKKEEIRLTFVGDIACDRNLLKAGYKNGIYNYTPVFSKVKDIFLESDYVVANFETVCAGSKNNYQEQYMTCNAPDELIEAMHDAGIRLVTTANNHCLDQGIAGLKRTIKYLKKNDIEYIGTNASKTEQKRVLIKEFDKLKIAFLAYTYSTNESNTGIVLDEITDFYVNLLREQGIGENTPIGLKEKVKKSILNILSGKQKRMLTRVIVRTKLKLGIPYMRPRVDKIVERDTDNKYLDLVKKDILYAKKNADYVIACPHFGGQFNILPGEYSNFLIDFLKQAGCDCVIGNHPHIVQKGKVDNGKLFAYSIGSFNQSISSDYMVHETKPEYSIMLHLYFNPKTNNISRISFSILKIVEDQDNMITVWPIDQLYEYCENLNDKQALEKDIAEIYSRFTEKSFSKIMQEYVIYEKE